MFQVPKGVDYEEVKSLVIQLASGYKLQHQEKHYLASELVGATDAEGSQWATFRNRLRPLKTITTLYKFVCKWARPTITLLVVL